MAASEKVSLKISVSSSMMRVEAGEVIITLTAEQAEMVARKLERAALDIQLARLAPSETVLTGVKYF